MIAEHVAVVTPPASADLVALATVKTRLGITGTASDVALTAAIGLASALIAGECRRALGAQTITETFRIRPAGLVNAREIERHALSLSYTDATVTAVTVDGVAADPATYESSGGMVRCITASGTRTTWPGSVIAVTYSAGYSLPGGAPPVLAEYCLALVTASHRGTADRSPDVKSETADGIGSVTYFDRGAGAMVLDDGMRAGLQPFRVLVV